MAEQIFAGRDARVPAGPWDVIVVGAGIYGLPAAFFLAHRHRARVLVIEDNTIPGECITVNTGGIIRIAYSDLDVVRVAAFAREIYRNPTARLGIARPVHLGFVPTQWARFVNEDAVPGILAELGRIAAGAGGRLRILSMPDYVVSLPLARRRTLGRIMELDDCTHVLADDDGGFADGGTALTGFRDLCLRAGVAFRLIPSHALSAERAMYFYPPGTSREELLRQFRPRSEGGRLVDMGAAGIAVAPR